MVRRFPSGAGPVAAPASALALSAFLLVAAVTGGVAPQVSIKAPYKGATVVPYTLSTTSGCGHLSVSKPPSWNRTSGIGGFSVNTSGRPCNAPPYGGGGSAYVDVNFGVRIPITASTGPHRIVAQWSVSVNVSQSYRFGVCRAIPTAKFAQCGQQTGYIVDSYGWLVDATNGSTVNSSTTWEVFHSVWNDSTCTYGKCTAGGSNISAGSPGANLPVALYLNASLVASHRYTLVVAMEGVAWSEFGSYYASLVGSGLHAYCSINMRTLGNHATLQFVSVT